MKTSLYLRGGMFPTQESEILDFISAYNELAENEKMVINHKYAEESYDFGDKEPCSSMAEIMKDCKAGKTDCVIVKNFMCVTTSTESLNFLLRFFNEFNVRFMSLDEQYDSFKNLYD